MIKLNSFYKEDPTCVYDVLPNDVKNKIDESKLVEIELEEIYLKTYTVYHFTGNTCAILDGETTTLDFRVLVDDENEVIARIEQFVVEDGVEYIDTYLKFL